MILWQVRKWVSPVYSYGSLRGIREGPFFASAAKFAQSKERSCLVSFAGDILWRHSLARYVGRLRIDNRFAGVATSAPVAVMFGRLENAFLKWSLGLCSPLMVLRCNREAPFPAVSRQFNVFGV